MKIIINGVMRDATAEDQADLVAAQAIAMRPPSEHDVNVERDRRIAAGTTFTVAGYGDIPITGRERDQIVLGTMLQRAQALKASGNTAASLVLRDAGNVTHQLTPDQAIDLVSQGIAWIEATMRVSWDMKDGVGAFPDGIPADYSDDRHWP